MNSPAYDIRCPSCGFSPCEEARYTRHTSIPRDQDDVLDCFDVVGCDDGNIMCQECACEFAKPLGD